MRSPATALFARPSIVRPAALVATLLTAIWSSAGPFDNPDPRIRLRVATQLVVEHRLVIARPAGKGGSAFRDAAGLYPSRFGIGQSLFFIPFVAIARPLTAAAPIPAQHRERLTEIVVATGAFAAVLIVTFTLSLAVAGALGASAFAAPVVAVLAVFGSSYWQIAKEGQEEAQIAIAVLLGFYGYLKWKQSGRLRFVWLSAGAATAATICRPTAVTVFIGLLGLFALAAVRGWRRGKLTGADAGRVALCFAVAGGIGLAVILAYNLFKTGNLLRSGYGAGAGKFVRHGWLAALWGATFGTDRGLVWQNLWLFPLAVATALQWRRLTEEARAAVVFAGVLLGSALVLYSAWIGWAGGFYAYGTRFQQHAVPMLAVSLAVGALAPTPTAAPRWSRRLLLSAVLILSALQLPSVAFVHGLEGLQAEVTGARGGPGAMPTAGRGGLLRTRYENTISKLATGTLPPLDTLAAERGLIPLLVDSSRWNFWPWRLQGYFGARAVDLAKAVWVVLVVASLGFWGVAVRGGSRSTVSSEPRSATR